MMKMIAVGVAVFLLIPAVTSAQSSRGRKLFWTGLGLSTGGAIMSLAGGYGMRKEECTIITVGRESFLSCINKPNTGMMIGGGSIAAVGSVLMIVGVNQTMAFGPRSFTYTRRF